MLGDLIWTSNEKISKYDEDMMDVYFESLGRYEWLLKPRFRTPVHFLFF